MNSVLTRVFNNLRARFLSGAQEQEQEQGDACEVTLHEANRPIVSFVVIVYDMRAQAERTIQSLKASYQLDVSTQEYEVIIIENESANVMCQEFLRALPDNFSYHLRAENEPTPVYAVNYGAQLARGDNICVMIDGARLLTPGVVRNIILGHRLYKSAVVTVPGYHIGEQLQQDAIETGYGIAEDQALIRSIAWPEQGYCLFDIACFSGACAPGFFRPNSESNCISVSRKMWGKLGGLDERFNLRGGGLVNLDLYRRACEFPGAQHVVLLGEGTFHQFHGGVTTGGEARSVRAAFIEDIKAQYQEIRGVAYQSPVTTPTFLGALPRQVLRFVHSSIAPLVADQRAEYQPPAEAVVVKRASV